MSGKTITAGNQAAAGFFTQATANRVGLVPGAAALASFANKPNNQGAANAYNSRVRASQQNGAGPVIAPTKAPWSFTDFATGMRSTITTKMKKRLK
jgi:hypothetical protein